jgi:pSer/pThr/pTyr-binding forkhead associated (FHA) protein
MPTLFALCDGPDIPVDRGTVMVGRHPECDVQLQSRRVSRRHCVIALVRGDVVIRDLGSTNGTWINGRRVAAGWIRPGDEVAIAHVRYHLKEIPSMRGAEAHAPSRTEDGSYNARSFDVSQ